MFLSETSFMQDTVSHNRDRVTISNLDHFARCKGSVPNEGRMIGVLESTRARLDKPSKNSVPSFYFFPSPFVPGSLEYINQ